MVINGNTYLQFPTGDAFNITTGGTQRFGISGTTGMIAIGDNTNLDSSVTITQAQGDCIRIRSNASSNTFKYGTIKLDPYNNNALGVQIVGAKSDSGYTEVDIGGGVDGGYAATQLYFWTAANTTTANGTLRWKIDSSGHLLPGAVGSYNIGSASAEIGDVYLADGKSVYLGSGQDVRMFYDATGSASFTIDSAAGYTYINSDALRLNSKTSAWNYLRGDKSDGVVKLYKSNSERLATSDTGITITGEVAASQDYPNLQPTLDLNFAATKKLDSRITYTRSGRASFINEHGLVEIVNSNVPRFDHDPVTRECKGLLIEEERTNLITYSNAPGMSSPNLGGSPQTNDSVSNITLPTGEKGTVRRYLAASGGGGGRWGDYSGTNNTNYTGSVWIRTVSGTGSAIIDINDGGGKTISLTEEWQRVTTTHSTNNTYRFFDIYFSSPVTIYYWGVQIEAGAFMTSYIPTNNATATRGGDRTYIDGQDFLDFYNQTEGTVISSHSILPNIPSNHNLYTYQIAPTGATAYAPLRILDKNSSIANSIAVASVYNNGYSFLTLDTGNPVTVAGRKYVIAVSIKKDDYDAVFDGGDLLSDSSGDLYTADHISIGYYKPSPQAYLNGHIQRLIYYPTKLTNNQLKTITS